MKRSRNPSLLSPHTHTTHIHILWSRVGSCPTGSSHIHSNIIFNTYPLPSYTVRFLNASTTSYSSLHPQSPAQCLAQSICLINVWWSNKWMNASQCYREKRGVFGRAYIYWKSHVRINTVLWKINDWNYWSIFSIPNTHTPVSSQQRISKHQTMVTLFKTFT